DGGDRTDALRAYQAGRVGASPLELRGIQLRLGALYLAQGNIKEARAAWEEAKRLAPADQALRRQIAEALAIHGAWRDDISELQAIEPLVAHDPAAQLAVLRRQADLAHQAGDRPLAERAFLRAYDIAAAHNDLTARSELTAELLRLHRVDKSASVVARK